MKTLYTLLIVLFIAGCSPAFNQYNSLDRAFAQGCNKDTIDSSLNTEGNYLEFKATCKKAQ